MIERFDALRTCDDVKDLSRQGVGEGQRMDYKERLGLNERGTLTRDAKRELARDVSALANAQGGLLVVGVKDPKREGAPPDPEDFVGVACSETFARDLENILMDSVSPILYPLVRVTENDFVDRATGERRSFVVIGVPQSARLHQVTAGKDYRFYRRAGYQNRPLGVDEVRLRLTAEAAAADGVDRLVSEELARVGRVFEGEPRVSLVAVPTRPHRFANEPASPQALQDLHRFLQRQPLNQGVRDPEALSPGYDATRMFAPAGDGARYFFRRMGPYGPKADVRVRRDGLVSSTRNHVELYSEPNELLWVQTMDPADVMRKEVPYAKQEDEQSHGWKADSRDRAANGYPSTVVDPAPAVRVEIRMLRASIRGFLRFVGDCHELLGYAGPVWIGVAISGGGSSFLAAAVSDRAAYEHLFYLSEHTDLRSSTEVEHEELRTHDANITEGLMSRLAWHFNVDLAKLRSE